MKDKITCLNDFIIWIYGRGCRTVAVTQRSRFKIHLLFNFLVAVVLEVQFDRVFWRWKV